MSEIPPVSITVSTVQGWPAIRANIASVEVAAAAAGGEVIVTDGSGHPAPQPGELGTTTIWRTDPGASVFKLRSQAYRIARAPIVAITEDHCFVPPDWATRMLAAHAAHPEAAAIGGSVENGATQTGFDWASYFVVQARNAPPIPSGPSDRVAGAVNVAYKREALERIDDFDGLGAVDVLHQRELQQSGGILLADDSIRVVHDQSLGRRGTIAIHYHSGRAFAGFIRNRMDRHAWTLRLGVLVIPYVRFARITSVLRRKGYGTTIGRVWPMILILLLAQAAGQIVGFLAGTGDSPNRVQ